MKRFILICLLSWLVTWQASEWIFESCPSLEIIDPYSGRAGIFGQGCLVNHGHFNYYPMTKTFETREAADKFIKDAPNYVSDFVVIEE